MKNTDRGFGEQGAEGTFIRKEEVGEVVEDCIREVS
jgi:hypothetical protein